MPAKALASAFGAVTAIWFAAVAISCGLTED